MQRARDAILALGGADRGQHVHEVPPGAVRAVPVARSAGDPARDDLPAGRGAVQRLRHVELVADDLRPAVDPVGEASPCAPLPSACGVGELFRGGAGQRSARRAALGAGSAFFSARRPRAQGGRARCPGAGTLRDARRRPRGRLDDRAVRRTPTGCRAILPAMANAALALTLPRPRARTDPLLREALRALDGLLLATRRPARCACSRASRRCGTRCSPATRWRRRACPPSDATPARGRRRGCWRSRPTRPGDWARAQPRAAGRLVLRAPQRVLSRRRRHLHGADGAAPGARRGAGEADAGARRSRAASTWMLGMQNRDGGWASFDRDNDKAWLTQVPFADHNAMIDPSTADITGRVLECLELLPRLRRRATRWSRARCSSCARDQTARRRLVRPLGRQLHLRHLAGAARAGAASARTWTRPTSAAPSRWLLDHQNARRRLGREHRQLRPTRARRAMGASTPSQTAWAVMGLVAAGDERSTAVRSGIRHLLEAPGRGAGDLERRRAWTGTGFPKVFYLHYHALPAHVPADGARPVRRRGWQSTASAGARSVLPPAAEWRYRCGSGRCCGSAYPSWHFRSPS